MPLLQVEPFQRGLKTLKTDCMINGRTRWQGFERAWIDQFENAPIGGGLAKCNPIAYWTFEDTFNYLAKYEVPHHPLHAKGYPSIGDAKDTIPIPEDGSVIFKDFKFEGEWDSGQGSACAWVFSRGGCRRYIDVRGWRRPRSLVKAHSSSATLVVAQCPSPHVC